MLRNPVPPPSGDAVAWAPSLVLIDFGLASASSSEEDMAVDLYVLERAFISTHPGSERLVDEMYAGYRGEGRGKEGVLKRLEAVKARGRKKECFG